MKEIKIKDDSICYDLVTTIESFQGSLGLIGIAEYSPVMQLLNNVVDQELSTIVLKFRELEFLNSSGINIISRFAITVRRRGNIQMVVQGSKTISWQGKSLKNLQRLMPSLQLELA